MIKPDKPGKAASAATKRLALRQKFGYMRRCVENNEPIFQWDIGEWEWAAGLVKGIGFSLIWLPGEFDFVLGPIAIGASRG